MFKLAIANVIQFPVSLTVLDGSTSKSFSFTLTAVRPTEPQLRAAFENEGTKKVAEFHADRCRQWLTGWQDQSLVMDSTTGNPAAFSAEALDCVMSLPGASTVLFNALMEAASASLGMQARAKN